MTRNRLRIVLVCSFFLLGLATTARPATASIAACGMLDQPCCMVQPACDTNLLCDGENNCVACGGLNQLCCDGLTCGTGFNCQELQQPCESVNGVPCEQAGGGALLPLMFCLPCGAPNQPCCDGTTCNQGAFCGVDMCEACGGNSEPCCPSEECDEGFICEPICAFETLGGDGGGAGRQCDREQLDGQGGGAAIGPTDQCVPCGAQGQPCCEESMCSEGTVCIGPTGETSGQGGGAGFNGRGGCAPCGELGELCCGDATCNSENLLCGGVLLCEACGDVGEQCCPGNTCPNAAAACIEGVCEGLPAVPLMGPGVITALLLVLTGIGALGLRRR